MSSLSLRPFLCGLMLFGLPTLVFAQFNPLDFDSTSTGPWSDIEATTLVVPQIADGSFTLDGVPSPSEYGGFGGVNVTPGVNAWSLDFPGDRTWDDAEDSSFTFFLAHDTNYFYVGVNALDDVVNSDDENGAFWKDDSIEIVTDVWNDNYDNNTDNSNDPYGGHFYANYEGRFSAWNEEAGEIDGTRFSSAVTDWTWGPEATEEFDVAGFGEETETGWNMELRFHKRLFEDPEAEIKLVEGTRMGFNIGMDDDDKTGPGTNGNGARTQDLELQYFWANRERFFGWNEMTDDGFHEPEDIASSFEALGNGTIEDDQFLSLDHDWGINGAGRLSHAGTGEIVFGGLAEPSCDPNTGGDIDGDGMVAFADFLVLSTNFGMAADGPSEGDIDCNGQVEFADFLVLSNNFGTAVATSAVPEPSGWCLVSLLLLGLSCARQKRFA